MNEIIPNELIVNIFSFLDDHSLKNLRSVSKRFHQILSDPSVLKNLSQKLAFILYGRYLGDFGNKVKIMDSEIDYWQGHKRYIQSAYKEFWQSLAYSKDVEPLIKAIASTPLPAAIYRNIVFHGAFTRANNVLLILFLIFAFAIFLNLGIVTYKMDDLSDQIKTSENALNNYRYDPESREGYNDLKKKTHSLKQALGMWDLERILVSVLLGVFALFLMAFLVQEHTRRIIINFRNNPTTYTGLFPNYLKQEQRTHWNRLLKAYPYLQTPNYNTIAEMVAELQRIVDEVKPPLNINNTALKDLSAEYIKLIKLIDDEISYLSSFVKEQKVHVSEKMHNGGSRHFFRDSMSAFFARCKNVRNDLIESADTENFEDNKDEESSPLLIYP